MAGGKEDFHEIPVLLQGGDCADALQELKIGLGWC